MKVLLLQNKQTQQWLLPMGGIYTEESMEEAVHRIALEQTQQVGLYLHQFHAFDPTRCTQSRSFNNSQIKNVSLKEKEDRSITVGYMIFVNSLKSILSVDSASPNCVWWDMNQLPALQAEHQEILLKAADTLVLHFNDYPYVKYLLPEIFSMPELQRLYETILGKRLDRANFQKKILLLAILKRLKVVRKNGAHKPAYLYSFHPKRYALSLEQHRLKLGF